MTRHLSERVAFVCRGDKAGSSSFTTDESHTHAAATPASHDTHAVTHPPAQLGTDTEASAAGGLDLDEEDSAALQEALALSISPTSSPARDAIPAERAPHETSNQDPLGSGTSLQHGSHPTSSPAQDAIPAGSATHGISAQEPSGSGTSLQSLHDHHHHQQQQQQQAVHSLQYEHETPIERQQQQQSVESDLLAAQERQIGPDQAGSGARLLMQTAEPPAPVDSSHIPSIPSHGSHAASGPAAEPAPSLQGSSPVDSSVRNAQTSLPPGGLSSAAARLQVLPASQHSCTSHDVISGDDLHHVAERSSVQSGPSLLSKNVPAGVGPSHVSSRLAAASAADLGSAAMHSDAPGPSATGSSLAEDTMEPNSGPVAHSAALDGSLAPGTSSHVAARQGHVEAEEPLNVLDEPGQEPSHVQPAEAALSPTASAAAARDPTSSSTGRQLSRHHTIAVAMFAGDARAR